MLNSTYQWRIDHARVSTIERRVLLTVLVSLSVFSVSITYLLGERVEQKPSVIQTLARAVAPDTFFAFGIRISAVVYAVSAICEGALTTRRNRWEDFLAKQQLAFADDLPR